MAARLIQKILKSIGINGGQDSKAVANQAKVLLTESANETETKQSLKSKRKFNPFVALYFFYHNTNLLAAVALKLYLYITIRQRRDEQKKLANGKI